MRRPAPHIREAVPGDAVALLNLWSLAVRDSETSPRDVEDAERALASLAADPDARLLVAESEPAEGEEPEIVAAIQLVRSAISPLVLDSVVHTSFLMVKPSARKHGYGHALMEAAVAWAEEKGIDQMTAVTDTNRETNRFFARLGLATFATVRHARTSTLRKKFSTERGRSSGGNRHLVEVLAQRRSMRRRQNEG